MADPYEKGIKAASKAEFITVPPDAKFLSGPTYRDKVRGALDFIGVDDRGKNVLVGDMRSDNLIENIGLLDLTPLALPLVIQEGSRAFKQGEYGDAALDLGFSALEMIPGAKLLTKPAKSFLGSLASKFSKSTDELGSLPTDPSKRTTMATIAAAPIAVGALGEVPVGKIMEDIVPVSDIPAVNPVSKKIVGNIVKNIGQPSRTETINELMELTDFGIGTQYGKETMEESVKKFSSEINKAKKYFELKKKTLDQDELDMISTNSNMADYLENLQIEFGYTDDQIIKFIDETDSTTRKNSNVWEAYLESGGEGDPDIGKKLGLGDESEGWENWGEDDFWDKFYGSNEADIAGNTIAKADE